MNDMKFIAAQKADYKISELCEALEVSQSGYYAHRARPVSARALQDVRLGVAMQRVFLNSRKTYGRLAAYLRRTS